MAVGGMVQEKGNEERFSSCLCSRHNAPVHSLLGFLFRKVMLKH